MARGDDAGTHFGQLLKRLRTAANLTQEELAERAGVSARLVSDLEARGTRATALPSVEAIVETIARDAHDGDTVALLSNGAFGGIYEKLALALKAR